MKAVVDPEKCIGCGLCVQVSPDVYEMDDDKARAIAAEISEDMTESARNGAEQCPVTAISVE